MKKSVKEQRMLALAEEFESSEMSLPEFAQHHSIRPGTFQYWVGKSRKLKKSKPDFLSIETPIPPIIASAEILIRYPNGVEVRLPLNFSTTELIELIKY
jgi:hypothetical protein